MKDTCELCGSKEDLLEFPTHSTLHTFCLACAAEMAEQIIRILPMGQSPMTNNPFLAKIAKEREILGA